ncbi:MAG: hypothetical protein FWF90_10905 [Promicromonosporaceae bacterium]|nr:hypothetical protein [Promicromonosporaceae bacterium]
MKTVEYECPVCGDRGVATIDEAVSTHGPVVSLISSECPKGCTPSAEEVRHALGI